MFKFLVSDKLEDEIKECYEEHQKISNSLRRIYELEDKIEDEDENIKSLTSKLDTIKKKLKNDLKELSKLKLELPQKQKRLVELEKIITEKENSIEIAKREAFQDYVLNMNLSDAFLCKLRNNTSTVDLLDKFCSSKKDFLILKEQFLMFDNFGNISLIVTPRYREIKAEYTQPTMTELKQNVGKDIHHISCSRLQPLLEEIRKIDATYKSISEGQKFAFERPFLIGGQTSDNRTGYGCEWLGGGDYIEGTLYGEVTDFMVVGIIFEGFSWH